MKFRRPYEVYESKPTCFGETKRPVYTLVNRHGERSLLQVDEIDISESINSYEGETSIQTMLRKYAMTGDASMLIRGGSYVYEDVSGCETDLARLIQSTREIALLKLQNSAAVPEVSKEGQGSAAEVNTGEEEKPNE